MHWAGGECPCAVVKGSTESLEYCFVEETEETDVTE